MDAFFPTSDEMTYLVQVMGIFVGFGLGLSACISVLGFLVRFIINIFREV